MALEILPAAHPRTILERSRRESRRSLVGWGIGVGAYTMVILAIFPSISRNAALSEAMKGYPEAIRKMFAVGDFTTGPGYLRAELFSFVAPLLLLIPGVLWGSAAVAGEEEHRTIDLVLANPVARRRFVVEKWSAVTIDLALLGTVLCAAILVSNTAFGLDVGTGPIVAAALASTLLAVLLATVAIAIGAATGRMGAARGITAAVATLAYLVSTVATLADWLRPVRPLSPWYQTLGVDPISHGFALSWHLLTVVAAIAILVLVAIRAYDGRDLAV